MHIKVVTSICHRVEDMAIKIRDEIRNWNVEWVPAQRRKCKATLYLTYSNSCDYIVILLNGTN